MRMLAFAALVAVPGVAQPQESDADLAKKLANPVAAMVSLPFQFNYDCCYGPSDGERYTLNIQPVVPIKLSDDWNMIVRTIVPIISQTETAPGGSDQLGFGDTTQTFFFSPSRSGGLTWGVGPALFYPTGTDGFSARQWAAGPAALVLKQEGRVTAGLLATQLWSFAGANNRDDINTTLLQPFFNYTFPNSTGIVLNAESSYDWEREQWTVPLNAGVTHLFKVGPQRIQMGVFGRYYLESPNQGPDWGLRFVATFLIP
jgi:hypothetical protein